jgi:hypothetical protein
VLNQIILMLGRFASKPAVHATAAVATLPVAATGMRAVGLTSDPDTTTLANGILVGALWLTLGMAALFGGPGGVVAELLSLHGHIELPHRIKRVRTAGRRRLGNPRYEVDLGILSRVFLGAAAGLALLAIYAPTSPTALVVNALIAGSAATGVFRLVQGRMLGQGSETRGQGSGVRGHGAKGQLSVVPELGQSSVA